MDRDISVNYAHGPLEAWKPQGDETRHAQRDARLRNVLGREPTAEETIVAIKLEAGEWLIKSPAEKAIAEVLKKGGM